MAQDPVFTQAYGHERLSTCVRRDVAAWQRDLQEQGLAPATINNHLASLSAFTTWVHAQAPDLFPAGDPTKGIGEIGLGPLEPRALDEDQIRSLKNLCDRLERFYQYKGRRRATQNHLAVRSLARPWRDRAIVYTLLSTGLRREELIRLDLDQIAPNTPEGLRTARRAQILRVRGKGKTERTVFLSADARAALADYLERERTPCRVLCKDQQESSKHRHKATVPTLSRSWQHRKGQRKTPSHEHQKAWDS